MLTRIKFFQDEEEIMSWTFSAGVVVPRVGDMVRCDDELCLVEKVIWDTMDEVAITLSEDHNSNLEDLV